jgi:cell division septation protein DedD
LIAARVRDLLEAPIRSAPARATGESDRLAALQPEELPAPPAPSKTAAPRTASALAPAGLVQATLGPPAVEDGIYCIQVAAYKELERATRFAEELQRRGYPARADSSDGYDRVLVGDFKTWRDAAAMEQQLKNSGYETWLRYVPAYERAAAP